MTVARVLVDGLRRPAQPTQSASPRPVGATFAMASSGNVANANAVATIPAVADKVFYIEGYSFWSIGATAGGSNNPTVTGPATAITDLHCWLNNTTTRYGNQITFPTPIPCAVNTACVATLPALGAGNTRAGISVWGYYLDA